MQRGLGKAARSWGSPRRRNLRQLSLYGWSAMQKRGKTYWLRLNCLTVTSNHEQLAWFPPWATASRQCSWSIFLDFCKRSIKKNPQPVAEGQVTLHLLFLNPWLLCLDPEEIRNAYAKETAKMAIPHRTDRLVETRVNKKNPQGVTEGSLRVHLLFLNP